MNRDLFLSILALDSYNCSYGQRLSGLAEPMFDDFGNAVTEVRIGEAVISQDSRGLKEGGQCRDMAADFYAITYEWNGETIISYRGTDNLVRDATTGYGVGLGISGVPQGDLAIDFYQKVAEQNIFNIA